MPETLAHVYLYFQYSMDTKRNNWEVRKIPQLVGPFIAQQAMIGFVWLSLVSGSPWKYKLG